jgi:hypothetical protein
MPSIRLGNNDGNTISLNGVIYRLAADQPTAGAITDVPTVANIAGQTWTYDDSNVPGGSNHRTWDSNEMGVCTYGTGNQGGPVTLTNDNTFYNMYTAPSAGIVRVYGTWGGGEHYDVKVNGSTVLSNVVADDYGHSQAVRVAVGDVVSFSRRGAGSQSAYSLFLPDVYP